MMIETLYNQGENKYMAKITIINFSGRKNGNCHNIANLIKQYHGSSDIVIFEFCDFSITACGKCNHECFHNRKKCPYYEDTLVRLYESIDSSDLVCYIVPNYCDYPCSNFFVFNERSQCYFQDQTILLNQYLAIPKKFIVVSNTEKKNFVNVFMYHVTEGVKPDILFISAKKYDKDSINGDLMSSKAARKTVEEFVIKGNRGLSENDY
jgi:hypothetical protein